MNRFLITLAAAASLTVGLKAVAQDTTTVITPDQTTVVAETGNVATYPTTGWDPSLLALAGSGLTLGSVAIKGLLRKRS